ncbi:MAG TPA: DUF4249 domain-containing protein [Prolixibacteraceae bacterium]|nr:DUF4249 domain-containing protein [Prolixibacteraceae bacterium]
MKNRSIIAIIIALLALFSACEKEIHFDQKLIDPKLVINSFIIADSTIEATIALSKPIPGFEKQFEWIDNAEVTLYVDDKKAEVLSTFKIDYPAEEKNEYYWEYSSNLSKATVIYRSTSTKAEAGKTYKLEVKHPKYETAFGETTLPEPIEIIELKTETKLMNYDYGQENQLIVKMKFKDRADENNYYRISYTQTIGELYNYYNENPDTAYTIYISSTNFGINLNSNDKILSNDEDANDFLFGSPNNRYNLFTDDLISGKEYEIEFVAFSNFSYSDYENNETKGFFSSPGEFYSIDVKLSTISREAFLYMKASNAQQWYGEDFFSEPVQAFSNIENGVGIVAGYSSSVKNISHGAYPIDTINYEYNQYNNY